MEALYVELEAKPKKARSGKKQGDSHERETVKEKSWHSTHRIFAC